MKERFLKWTLRLVIGGVVFYALYAFYPEGGLFLRDKKLVDKEREIASKPKSVEDTIVLEEPTVESMYVQERSARVRSGPGIDYRVIDSRRLGDKIFTNNLEGGWYRIVDPKDFDKTVGWIHGSLLGEMPPGQ